MPSIDKTRQGRRFVYLRYADDWIIVTNASIYQTNQLKNEISDWLKENLDAELALDKTLITDMRKAKAHFLGFDIVYRETRKLVFSTRKDKVFLRKVAGSALKIAPDSQRLINRLYMKGYCDKKGFPISIPWLSTMEPFMIIEKFNSVIGGFANFYTEFISNKNKMARWIYILRFSCLKTLAQKYQSSITKIFKRYHETDKYFIRKFGKTINIKLRVTHKENYVHKIRVYEKDYRLKTYLSSLEDAIQLPPSGPLRGQKKKYEHIHEVLSDKGKFLNYAKYMSVFKDQNYPSPLEADYLDRIKWTNWRTSCSFTLSCCLCGKPGPSEMHHVKHVRKTKYTLIPEPKTWDKLMALRNRKQIPVCRKCHMDLIHPEGGGNT